MTDKKRFRYILSVLKTAMFLLVTIGIIMVIRRLVVLNIIIPGSNKPAFDADQDFKKHAVITILHIIPGALFMISGAFQLMPRIRNRNIQLHRWNEGVFITAAYIIGVTAIVLSFIKQPIGGITEAVASIFFSIFFLTCISKSLYYILRKQVLLHREWMIRTFSIGLAIVTVRLISVFTFIVFKLPPSAFLGTAFWMGFSLHAIVAEIWISYTRESIDTNYKSILLPGNRKEIVHQ